MNLNELKEKRILILGFGKEGVDTLRFLRRIFPNKVFGVGDRRKISNCQLPISNLIKKDKKVRLHFGENYLKTLKKYDIIIKSPGIPPKIIAPYLKEKSSFAESYGGQRQIITSQTDIFLENCPGKIIGVTGTKGKSTTTALIYQILKEARLKAHLVGNIGKPVLHFLLSATEKDIFVYELSSFQLQNIKKSPHIAIFLNIFPEHLDYYRNFQEYVRAKANITRYQTNKDYLIFNAKDKLVREIARKSKAKKIPIPNNSRIITNKQIPLIGKFNLQNVIAATQVARIFGISNKDMRVAIKNFKPLPHRLEYVGTFKGVKFYNDSLATLPEPTISAINTFGKNVKTLILGGFDRGQDFKKLVKKILDSKVKNIILFPSTGRRIWEEVVASDAITKRKSVNLPKHFFVNTMKDAVELSYRFTEKGKICLLSPASPSFGLFKDYRERGNLFKKLVKKLSKK